MSNPNFDPTLSTHAIWVGDNEELCLTDKLEEVDTDISTLKTGKADTNHTHTGYAAANHTHTEYAPAAHSHVQGDITGLSDALDGKAAVGHTHSGYAPVNHSHSGYAAASHSHGQSEITGLSDALAGKAAANHTHTGYAAADHTHSGYAAANHTHTGYAPTEHTHDTDDISGLSDLISQGSIPIVAITSTDGVNFTGTVPGMTALTIGKPFIVIPNMTSTDYTVKLNINGLGAKALRQGLSAATSATVVAAQTNWLAKNKPVLVMWDGLFWKAGINRPAANGLYGTVPIDKGGTGAETAAEALTALGAASAAALTALEARVAALESR